MYHNNDSLKHLRKPTIQRGEYANFSNSSSKDKVYHSDNSVARSAMTIRTAFMKHIATVKPEKVYLNQLSGGRGFFRVEFENGDHYESDFTDYVKMLDFASKVEALKGAEKWMDDRLVGTV